MLLFWIFILINRKIVSMYSNFVNKTNKILPVELDNSKKLMIFAVYGDGGRSGEEISRHKQVLEHQNRLFEHYQIPINYFYHNFNYCGMGPVITQIVNNFLNEIDYFIIIDIDIAPLRPDFWKDIINKIKDGKTLFGGAQTSNHIYVNGLKNHLYASLSFFGVSSELYKRLDCPSFEYNGRGDVAEEIAWRVEEKGYSLCLSYPSSFLETTEEEQKLGACKYWDLGIGLKFGLGTVYGDYVFHATMQNLPRSTELFINKCNELINAKR